MSDKDTPAAKEAPKAAAKEAAAVDASAQTPGGVALAAVGEPPEDATDEELEAHNAEFQAAYLKARRG